MPAPAQPPPRVPHPARHSRPFPVAVAVSAAASRANCPHLWRRPLLFRSETRRAASGAHQRACIGRVISVVRVQHPDRAGAPHSRPAGAHAPRSDRWRKSRRRTHAWSGSFPHVVAARPARRKNRSGTDAVGEVIPQASSAAWRIFLRSATMSSWRQADLAHVYAQPASPP